MTYVLSNQSTPIIICCSLFHGQAGQHWLNLEYFEISRTLGVFGRKLEGSHSVLYCYFDGGWGNIYIFFKCHLIKLNRGQNHTCRPRSHTKAVSWNPPRRYRKRELKDSVWRRFQLTCVHTWSLLRRCTMPALTFPSQPSRVGATWDRR